MARAPCCDKVNVKKGQWSPEEDAKLKEFIDKYGNGGNWIALPQKAGLNRCGKSCRLRWLNYLRPNIKHGEFSEEEDRIICSLYASIGRRWSIIAAQLPGRTDNDIKNHWKCKLKKKLVPTNVPSTSSKSTLSTLHAYQRSSSNTQTRSEQPPLSIPPILFQAQGSLWGPNNGSCSSSGLQGNYASSNGFDYGNNGGFHGYFGNNNTATNITISIASIQYDIEEVKQLISSSNDDEKKRDEKDSYY